jgi:hypothetical protein
MTSVRSRLRCPSVPTAKALASAEESQVFAHPDDVLRVIAIKQRGGLWEIVQYGSSPSPDSQSKTLFNHAISHGGGRQGYRLAFPREADGRSSSGIGVSRDVAQAVLLSIR